MKIHVYDTYVKRSDGETMHFDVLINEDGHTLDKALEGAKKYLVQVGEGNAKITSEECRSCHVGTANPKVEAAINKDGYYILKMGDNCL